MQKKEKKTFHLQAYGSNEMIGGFIFFIIILPMASASLCWSEIRVGWIVRKRNKTGAALDIPVLPPLAEFLKVQYPVTGDDQFVLPEHAQMYRTNSTGITDRVKQFLEKLSIATSRKTEGRNRAVSTKDIHNLRHEE